MGDIITLARAATAKPDANNLAFQNILEAVDVSAYDSIDFQVTLLATTGSPTDVTIAIVTSMQNEADDPTTTPARWPEMNDTGALTVAPFYVSVAVPDALNEPMYRYIRWKVTFNGGTNPTAIFSIMGIARRGVRR